jgi:tRNA (guanine37-N1)-methyltransferase
VIDEKNSSAREMPLIVDVVTLFPEMFVALTASGIPRKALEAEAWSLGVMNPRDFSDDKHRTVDDRPFGGGPGMVLMVKPMELAINAAKARQLGLGAERSRVIYLSPQGRSLDHATVLDLSASRVKREGLVLVCGRYEGVDERLIERLVDEEISIGDFVVSGGELPAMLLIDAVVRHLPGALNDVQSAEQDSFVDGLLDCPHYTRPEVYEESGVPEVLLSGNHARIRRWRLKESLARTLKRRPDLLENRKLSKEEAQLLAEVKAESRMGNSVGSSGEQLCGQYNDDRKLT